MCSSLNRAGGLGLHRSALKVKLGFVANSTASDIQIMQKGNIHASSSVDEFRPDYAEPK
jgi:hypothetical protein